MLVSYFWCVSNFDQYSKSVSCLTSYNSQPCYLLFYNHRVNILSIYASFDLKTANILCREILQVVQTTVRLCLVRRAAQSVLIMWPCRDISHIQVLFFYLFPTPPIKLKLGLHIGQRLLIGTHLDQSNYLANQQQVLHALLCHVPTSAPCSKCWAKTIFLSQTGNVVTFLHPIFFCKGHILSTGGAALTHKHEQLLIMLLTSNFHFWCFHGAVILSEC